MKLSLVAFLATISASKVQVQLEASWNSGPLYLEATEFIHSLGDNEKTISFIDKISSTDGLCSMSDGEMLNTIKEGIITLCT